MNLRSLVRAAVGTLLLLPLAVSSTPPSLFWYLHVVPGRVERASGSLANHTVVLFGQEGEQWQLLGQCDGEGAERVGTLRNVFLTREDGRFQLAVSVCRTLDSLAVAVVYPDTVILGEPFSPESVQPEVVEKTGRREDGSFCDGDEYSYEDGYVYRHAEKIVHAR